MTEPIDPSEAYGDAPRGGAGGAQAPDSDLLRRLSARESFAARYTIRGEVAQGGMGAILRVWDEELRRHLAMKVILGKGGADKSAGTPAVESQKVARFLEEAQVTGQLDHPGIVPVHELGLDAEGRVYFTMKLVKGQDLKAILDLVREGRDGWSQTRALGVLQKICEAMAFAHSRGVIHRDLKPANVMVGRFGEVYVMDWGLAKVLGQEDTKDVRLQPPPSTASAVRTERREAADSDPDSPLVTMDGDVVGTPAYMAPEQAEGRVAELGPASDVYSAGAILYHLLTGGMPYVRPGERASPYMVLRWVREGPPPTVHRLAPDAPSELAAICEKAMARDAAHRYPDMQAMAEDLRAYLEGRVVKAHRTGAVAELRKWVQRNPGTMGASFAAAMIGIVGIGGTLAIQEARTREVSAALGDYRRMADARLLSEIEGRADALLEQAQPPREELDRSLADARGLVVKREVHRAKLVELSARIARGPEKTDPASSNEQLWQRDVLADVVTRMDALSDENTPSGRTARIRRKLDLWETTATLTPDWKAAIESIADPAQCPAYGGLRIVPQYGLVPIHRDPRSGLWEFAHLETGAPPEIDGEGKLVVTEEMGVVLVLLPGGTFWMGAQREGPAKPNFDPVAQDDESPVTELTLAPFLLSKYEMTQRQWMRLGAANDIWERNLSDSGTLPVESVSWDDCHRWLPRAGLVLPTEAQWEFATRAGTSTPWWTGSDGVSLAGAANLAPGSLTRIGSLRENAFGLHDVHGSVWEWCRDNHAHYNVPAAHGDGERLDENPGYRVIRGGSFVYAAAIVRSALRMAAPPGYRSFDLGVRPSRGLTD